MGVTKWATQACTIPNWTGSLVKNTLPAPARLFVGVASRKHLG